MKGKTSKARSASKAEPKKLSPEKSRELIGLALLVLGAILLAALVTYHPTDPSFVNPTVDEQLRPLNLIGPVGAQVASVLFEFVGVAALLVPVFLLVAGWRRVRHLPAVKTIGRGLGVAVLLACLPPLLQLAIGEVSWRGEAIWVGGGFGRLLADAVSSQLGVTGAVAALLGGVAIGFALLIQSTLGEVLARWNRGLRSLGQRLVLVWSRNRERGAKDRARQRVMEKQLKRAAREESKRGKVAAKAKPKIDLPLRVSQKPGQGKFSIRRAGSAAASPGREVAAPPQKEIPFPKQAKSQAILPPSDLLESEAPKASYEENELIRLGEVIRARCAEFGVMGSVEGISPGPVITVFEFQPAPGVKVSQIVNLQDDLALALKAEAVRIDRIPGRSTLGIEVPNDERAMIRLGYLLGQKEFKRSASKLTMGIGMTIQGEPYFADLATMPHLLVAGATGSGKSVGLQSMITSILMQATREEVQFIFIDPKRIELGVYKEIPHLKTEVVVEPKKAANALRWAVAEMERRYRVLAEVHVRSIAHYNQAIRDPKLKKKLALTEEEEERTLEELTPLPYYVVVIDELSDLMMVASNEVEIAIARLAQMARAVGIHMIVATQRPSVDVLTGTIKANFPCRMAFATASRHDSRTILDQIGSEKLLGKGDMLFMAPGTSRVIRLHGPYVGEEETARLIRWLKQLGRPEIDPDVLKPPVEERGGAAGGGAGDDELFDEAARLVVAEGQGSASFLQRRLRIGFSRAARLIDLMERDGLLGPPQGSKPREVLVKADFFEEWDEARRDVEV